MTEPGTMARKTPAADPHRVRTVCLTLGPYRNLTTLTASVFALHPNCQVLNHGSVRVFGNREIDFLQQYSDERFKNFIRYALQASASGQRGKYGGSITLSHAFDPKYRLRELYQSAFGERLLKDDVQCLFWKESLRTANYIRAQQTDLGAIFAATPRLKFLLPVRNPLDCAVSNLKTGHAAYFPGQPTMIEQVLVRIFDEYLWFLKLASRHPERFFCFFEHGFDEQVLRDIARFLGITPDQRWLQDSLAVFSTASPYLHPQHLLQFYTQCVQRKFDRHPEFAAQLMKFIEQDK